MNGLGIIAAGLLTFCAAAPGAPLLLIDLVTIGPDARPTISAASCARSRALVRCIDGGWCNVE